MPPTLSTPVAVVMILSLVLGCVNQVVQTGSLFGTIIPPKPWLPEFTIAASFLGGVVAYFGGLSPLVLTGSTIFYAVAAGVANLLVSSAPAVAVHAHYVIPSQLRAMRLAASKPKGVVVPTPPPVQT